MRGSLKTQITAVLKLLLRVGLSRHFVKSEYGRSGFIHSIGTFEKNFHRLAPLAKWLKTKDIKQLDKITNENINEYLMSRLEHHLEANNVRTTFTAELSAVAALERGLNQLLQQYIGQNEVKFDFSNILKYMRNLAKALPRKNNQITRTLENPEAVIDALSDNKHKLIAMLQLKCGCRAEGVGVPRRWKNPLTYQNFCGISGRLEGTEFKQYGEENTILPKMFDPVNGELRQPFWTKEKGGKLALKFCPIDLAEQVLAWIDGGKNQIEDDYINYLSALNAAMEQTNQAGTGRGTHTLRFCFAQRRYLECIKHGLSDEQAKQRVSYELSHNRPDITECYL